MLARRVSNRWDVAAASWRLLIALVATDGLFLVLHASHVRYDIPDSGMWLISRDRGFPELFQYLKEATIVVLLARLAVARRRWLYPAWALLFGYLLVDDSMEVHETAGEALAELFGFGTIAGIEGRDLGQILVSAIAGGSLLLGIALATANDRSSARNLSKQLLILLAGLAFFGIVTDVIDAIDILGLVEDGGEMLMITLMLVVVFQHGRPGS